MIRVLTGDVSGFKSPYSTTGQKTTIFISNAEMEYVSQSEVSQGRLTKHGERSFIHNSVEGTLYRVDSAFKYEVWPATEQRVECIALNSQKTFFTYRFAIPGIPPVTLWANAGPPPVGYNTTMWGFNCQVGKRKDGTISDCHYNAFWYIAANAKRYTYQYFSITNAWWYPKGVELTPDNILNELLTNRLSTTEWTDWDRRPHPGCVTAHLRPIQRIPDFLGYSKFRRLVDDTAEVRLSRRYLLSDLSQDIADHACDLDINSIAFAKEFCENIVNLYKIVQGDLSTMTGTALANDPSVKRFVKTLADVELSSSYGLSLTIADTQELLKSFERQMSSYKYGISRSQTSHSYSRGGVSYSETFYCKTWYSRSCAGFQGLLNDLFNQDAFLTLQNVWDLIPYSFVVDWVLPIEQFLNQQDANTRLSVLPISEVLLTTKTIISYSSDVVRELTAGLSGQISVTLYERDASASLPPIYPHYQGRDQFQSWLQAGALITQKILK